ncbi:MAG: hypothetical protein NUV32_00600 [Exilispira sp.]|nr:hypothetical protein [Exilispira sp.]
MLFILFDYNLIIEVNQEKVNNVFLNKINRILSSFSGQREIYSERFIRWYKAINIIKKFNFSQIIIGLGTRSYYSLNEFIRPDGSRDYPHNFILSAFIEGGLLKTILILIISFYSIKYLIKKTKIIDEKKRIMLLLLYFIWLIQVFISGDEFFNSKQIYLIYFIINTYISVNNKKEPNEKNSIDSIE